MRMQRISLSLPVLLAVSYVLGVGISEIVAAPGGSDPLAAMDVRQEKDSQDLKKAGEELYRRLEAQVKTFRESMASGKLKQVKMDAIGQVWVGASQLARIGERLVILGEPAGTDFGYRSQELKKGLGEVMTAYKGLPGVAAIMARQLPKLRKESQLKKQRVVPQIAKFAAQQQWPQVDAGVEKASDELELLACWYDYRVRRTTSYEFTHAVSKFVQASKDVKMTAARGQITAACQQSEPKFEEILQAIRTATASVKSTGQATVGDASVTGPELMQYAARQWLAAQNGSLRCRGLAWTLGPKSPWNQSVPTNHAKFCNDIVPLLADVIVADTAHVNATNARERYISYLRVLSRLVSFSANGKAISDAVEPKLAALAAKDPKLVEEIAAYRRATAPLLRWRERTAQAYANVRKAKFPTADAQLNATKIISNERTLPKETSSTTFVQKLSKALVDQPVLLENLVGLPTGTRMACSRYLKCSYSRIAIPQPVEAEIAALKSDLMVSKDSPPLTLNAATAVVTSQQGDAVAVGGTFKSVYLEPLVWRYNSLPPLLQTIFPLGPLPTENTRRFDWTIALVIRFDVTPQWVQQRYFFVDLQPAAAAPAAAQ